MTWVRKLKHCLRFLKSCNSQSRNKINIFFWRWEGGGGGGRIIPGNRLGTEFFSKNNKLGPRLFGTEK